MSQDREPMQRELTLHSLFGHLWLLALFGGLIALFTSINSEFSPYFYWPYLVPAVIAVIAVVAWALWHDASTRTKQLLAALLVLAGAWLVIGPWLTGFANLDFMPATRASVLAGGTADNRCLAGGRPAGRAGAARPGTRRPLRRRPGPCCRPGRCPRPGRNCRHPPDSPEDAD